MGGDLTEPGLNKYYDTFEEFKTYINKIHKQPIVNQTHEGYLVNYEDYIELKELVYKYYQEKQQKQKFRNNLYDEIETKWIDEIKSKKLKTESFEKVKKQVSNGKKFVIINNDHYEIICKKPESQKENYKIYYIIEDKDHLIIDFNKEKSYRFKNNYNIIAKPELFYSPSPIGIFQQNTSYYNQNIPLAQPPPYNLNNNNNNLMINQNIGNPVEQHYFIIDNDLSECLSSYFNQANKNNCSQTKMIINKLNQNIPNINRDNLYLYQIKSLSKKINNKDFYFPTNFQIIKQNELMK